MTLPACQPFLPVLSLGSPRYGLVDGCCWWLLVICGFVGGWVGGFVCVCV